jgi:hypothetical protein
VSDEARDALTSAASAFPGGEQVVDQVIGVARQALSDSIHEGFIFVLFSVLAAIAAALVMKNVRLDEKVSVTEDAEEPTGELLPDVAPEGQAGAARR